MKKIILSLCFVLGVFVSIAQDYRSDVVILDSVSKIANYYGGSKLIYVKDTTVGGYFYLYQGSIAADGKDVITGANSSKWRRVLAANIDYTVLQLPSYAALRTLSRLGGNKTYVVYTNGVNNYFRYDASDNSTADDTAMIIVGVGGARYKRIVDNGVMDVRWFGAVADDGQDDWYNLQRCFNYAVYNSYKKIVFPGGQFNLSKGLLIWKDANNDGNPEFINVSIEGYTNAYSGSGQNETVLYANNRNSFALGIQRGKGCEVKNINFNGTNNISYSVAQAWGGAQTYILDSQRTNTYSPYAGLVLDPFGSSVTGTDRYPGFESYYAGVVGNGGSTDCKFYNLVTSGFVVGVILTPNGNTQNNESHVFDGLWMTNCREGFVTTNSQERQVLVKNFKAWSNVKTIFQNIGYGNALGEPPNIDGGNVAGNVYQIFNLVSSGSSFPVVSIRNVYGESFYRIGTISARNVGFKDCHLALGITNDYGLKAQDWVYSGSSATFDNCMILFYDGGNATPMNFIGGGYFKFTNCYMSNPIGTVFTGWTNNSPNASYNNCRFYTRNGYITDDYVHSEFNSYSFYSGNASRYTDLGQNNVTYSYGERFGVVNLAASQYRRVTSKMKRWISLGSVSVTVTNDSASATISSLAGKTQFQNAIVFDLYDLASSGQQCMRIKSIDGSGNVKFDRVVNRLTSGTMALWIEDYQTLGQPILFDYDGTTMTNIIREGSITNLTLSTSSTYFYLGKAVTVGSSSSGSATPSSGWAPLQNAIKRGILTSYDYEEYGYSYGHPMSNSYYNDGVLFTQGAYYTNTKTTGADSLVIGYKCTRSGIKGSSYLPEFETIYRSKLSGSGFKLASDASNQLKSLTAGRGMSIDSAVASQVNFKVDTAFLKQGTYTPTVTLVTNVDAATVTVCNYQKIDSIIYVYGEISIDPTANNTDTRVDITLPITTTISQTYNLAGNASSFDVSEAVRIYGNTSNGKAVFRFKASDNASHTFSFQFQYRIELN